MVRWILDIFSYMVLFTVLLFAPAGTLHWSRAWVLLIVLLIARVASTISIARVNAAVLHERSKPPIQTGQPFLDKILVSFFMASFAALVAFISFDVFRFHLLPAPTIAVSTIGMTLFIIGWCIITLVLRTNPFAATVVRHQKERNHSVVGSGIYRIVRHPMYSALGLVMIGMCLWLESYAGAILSMVPMATLIIRIFMEERFLRRELPGYEDYIGSVRWRLVPGIW